MAVKTTKTSERIILDYIMSPGGIYRDGEIIDQYEKLDEEHVANTHEKRALLAYMISTSCQHYNISRQKLMQSFPKDASEKFARGLDIKTIGQMLAIDMIEHADKAAIMGFIIGRYSQNNEVLDTFVNHCLEMLDEACRKSPEIIEDYKRQREEKMARTIEKTLKECPNASKEDLEKWTKPRHQ